MKTFLKNLCEVYGKIGPRAAFVIISSVLTIITALFLPLLESNIRYLRYARLIVENQDGNCKIDQTSVPFDWSGSKTVHIDLSKESLILAERLFDAVIVSPNHQQYILLEKTHSEQSQDVSIPDHYVTLLVNAEISIPLDVQPGLYKLEVYAKHDQPGPVLLRVFINDSLISTLSFDKDDDSWETRCIVFYHQQRANAPLNIRVRFANDGGEGGSRDASIGWWRITPVRIQARGW